MGLSASVVLVCPTCGKQYQVDPQLVRRGKRVRCRLCAAVFVAFTEPKPSHQVDEDQIVAWLRQPRTED